MSYHQVTASSLASSPTPQPSRRLRPPRRGTEHTKLYTHTALSSASCNSSFTYSTSSTLVYPEFSSFSGGTIYSPRNININKSDIVRSGWASVKEDGGANFFWSRKWLVLRDQTLSFHKNENSIQQKLIRLSDISIVERVGLRPYCLVIETGDKRVCLSLKSDEEVYGWQEDVYNRSSPLGVSHPTNFVHKVHVGFDPITGGFTALPEHWNKLLAIMGENYYRTPQSIRIENKRKRWFQIQMKEMASASGSGISRSLSSSSYPAKGPTTSRYGATDLGRYKLIRLRMLLLKFVVRTADSS